LGVDTSDRGEGKWEGEGVKIWSVCFVNVYENRIMKPVEIFLRRLMEGGWGRMMESVNLIKIYCKHISKCHSESPPCTTTIC
jgi:hypothetical protein